MIQSILDFSHFFGFLMSFEIRVPLLLSLKVSSIAVIGLVPVAFVCAFMIHKARTGGRFFRAFGFVLDTLVQLPLVLPPVVVGYGLLWALGPQSFWGSMYQDLVGTSLAFSTNAAVLAGMVVGLPFLVKAIQLSLRQISADQIWVLESLGIQPFVSRLLVLVLHTWPGLVSGSLLAFARSFGEFGATMIFASSLPGVTRTVPLSIYTYSEMQNAESSALALCVLSVIVCIALVFAARSVERIGASAQGHFENGPAGSKIDSKVLHKEVSSERPGH